MAGTGKQPFFRSGVFLWTLAIIITLASAVYQRVTGPTYPVSGEITIDGSKIQYKLLRSHGGEGDQPVSIACADTMVRADLYFRRYPTNEPWTTVPMQRLGDQLVAQIPHQPPAGKVEYYIVFHKGQTRLTIPEERSVITRFKGAVPLGVLLPHILLMFTAMLLSTRTGLEALFREGNPRKLAWSAFLTITVGGMILGPIVQKYAFGAFWTGVPFGWDLTDNKTLIAWLAWLIAILRMQGNQHARPHLVAASVVTLVVFLIPHSVLGSELKYTEVD